MTPRGRLPGGIAAIGALTAGLVAMVAAARTAGATPDEPGRHLPGDELLPDAPIVTTRATTIAAPPAAVWPWLVQMGYHRGGWYAIDALERLIGAGDFLTGDSADFIVEELQNLAVGERVPLNDRMHLVVARFEPDHALVLALPDQPLEWIWSFVLEPIDDGSDDGATRLLIRTRIAARDRWVTPLLPLFDAGHMTMELVQLRNLRERAEAHHAATSAS